MAVVKKIGVLSIAKLQAIIMALVGLAVGIFYAIFAKAIAAAGTAETTVAPIQFGWIGIIIFPIFYGVLGFLTGAVGAWVYNLLAKWIGGVELELTK